MLYELRIYETKSGGLDALVERFAGPYARAFQRLGFRPIGFWTEDTEDSHRLVYLLAWESAEERERAWAAFTADPDRRKAQADGTTVTQVSHMFLRPTPYSKLQ